MAGSECSAGRRGHAQGLLKVGECSPPRNVPDQRNCRRAAARGTFSSAIGPPPAAIRQLPSANCRPPRWPPRPLSRLPLPRHLSDQRDGLHRVLRRQRPAVFHLLPDILRLPADRLPGTGNRRSRPRQLPAATGQDHLVLTTPIGPEGPIADHVRLHGDGVRDWRSGWTTRATRTPRPWNAAPCRCTPRMCTRTLTARW